MSPEIPIILIGIMLIAGAVIYGIFFNQKAIVKRRLRKTPYHRISRIATGEIVRVVGKVEIVGMPLRAPLSGRPCALHHVKVEEKRSNGKSSHWYTLTDEMHHCLFVIRDGSNYACTDASKLKSYIVPDRAYRSGLFQDASAEMEQYLNARGYKSETFLGFNKAIRYNEGVLEAGEMIAVAGKAEWRDAHSLGLPESYGRVLLLVDTAEQPVYLSDDPETVKTEEQIRDPY